MIRMTWPDYANRRCWFRGREVHLSPQERCILSTLLLHRGHDVRRNAFIEELYPNPDIEPDWAFSLVAVVISRLRHKLPGLIHSWKGRSGLGYWIALPDQRKQLWAA